MFEADPTEHLSDKEHLKLRDDLGLKEDEDLEMSIMKLVSAPGDITEELQKEREEGIKSKFKKIKQQMLARAETHDDAANQTKDVFNTQNRK